MDTKNLNDLTQSIRSLGVSEEFIKGALFVLGGTVMRVTANISPEDSERAQQWVLRHDINEVKDDILGRMYDGLIRRVLEEFFYKLKIEIPMRDIKIENNVYYLCTPTDYRILPKIDLAQGEMREISRIYFAAIEEIGAILGKSEYSHAEAYLAGICFFSSWWYIDKNALGFITQSLLQLSPPALKFFLELPSMKDATPIGWLPTQIALWGFVTGLDDGFMRVAWPYQSWMLYKTQNPIPGIEDLNPSEFFSHCYEISKIFASKNISQIGQVADLEVGPDDVPEFTGTGSEREEIFALIERVWGYDPANDGLSVIEQKQVNGCIIFILFCSLCRAYRAGHRFEIQQASSEDHQINVLQAFPAVLQLDDFLMAAEEKLEAYPRFSIAAALATSQGKDFKFFISKEPIDPVATHKILQDLVLATRSSEIYVLYFADLTQFFQEDLGPFQSLAFRVDSKGSAPYWFCRMVPEQDTWRIRPFSLMDEHDRNGSLFLSDFSSAFRTHSKDKVTTARQKLDDWKPENDWNWSQYDC